MCLAVPMKVTAIEGDEIVVELQGVTQRARADLLPEVELGDHVIVHAGYAITCRRGRAAGRWRSLTPWS